MRAAIIAMCLSIAVGACAGQAQPDLVSRLQKLADKGNAEAIYHVGMAYHTGSGVRQDHARALAAFRSAAEKGDPLGAYKLGCYYSGQGEGLVAEDLDQALKYKLVAAEAGYALAQQDVAALYARSGNIATALVWIKKAADQGWPDALMTYASVFNGNPDVPRDPAKTAAYFRLFLQRDGGNAKQQSWLKDFEDGLSSEDRARARRMVEAYRPTPTALTLKALSGQRAGVALLEREG